jgi:hypothetical protein
MKVWTTLSPEEIRQVAQSVGVRIFNDNPWNQGGIVKDGRAWNFRLGLKSDVPKRGDAGYKYQRTSQSAFNEGRKVAAVCWHGHRDFMRAVFALDPNARFKTAIADWKGSEDFERRFAQTAFNNVGSMMYPMFAKDVCTCSTGEWDVDASPGGSYAISMQQGMIKECPHVIFTPDHYRADGSCRCDEKDNADMREWGYTWDDRQGRWAA